MKEELIGEWFVRAFNREPRYDPNYYREWKERFKNGTAIDSMDSERLRFWKEVIQED